MILGIKFPASVFEWYNLRNSEDLLYKYSNRDEPIKLKELNLIDKNYIIIMEETQGAYEWAIDLNNMEDPEVYITHSGSRYPWRKYSDKFSDFIYTQFFDWSGPLNDENHLDDDEPLNKKK